MAGIFEPVNDAAEKKGAYISQTRPAGTVPPAIYSLIDHPIIL
jgi:hypothetical protein